MYVDYRISIEDIGKQLHISRRTISNILKEHNINISYGRTQTKVNEDYFDTMDERRYWMLGLYASDGNVTKNGSTISISQSGDNGSIIIDYLESELSCENCRKDYDPKDGFQVRHKLSFCSEKIKNVFEKYNIVPQKTWTYRFPDIIPSKFIGAFLAGYIDGDGCISFAKNKNEKEYLIVQVVGTKEFIYEVKKIVPAKCSNPRKRKTSNVYEIEWAGKNAVELCDWMYDYPLIFHSHKYEKYLKGKDIFINSYQYKYDELKRNVFNIFSSGLCTTMMDYMYKYNLKTTDENYKRIYRWLKEWFDLGLIDDYKVRKT